MNGAAVVENELSNTNGAGVDGPKLLAPNENPENPAGLAKGKLAFSEADALFTLAASVFSVLVSESSFSENAVDTTRSPRNAA